MSILSKVPDGFGYYYGFFEDDPRQINVRQNGWQAIVGSEAIDGWFSTKDEAEAAAIAFLQKK